MCLRKVGLGVLAGLWLCAVSGCRKSSQDATPPSPQTPSAAPRVALPDTVARLHWLGKKRLEGETNASFFMSIWDLPESSKLEAQTLDKLALALAGSLTKSTNPASSTNLSLSSDVRPLLEDLLNEESYIEVRSATNQPGELALAIRLNEDRAGIWETNLARALDPLSAVAGDLPGNHAWRRDFDDPTKPIKNRLCLARVGTWTIVTLTRAKNGEPKPTLLDELSSRIQQTQSPFATSPTNFWVDADLDLKKAAQAMGWNWTLPSAVPRILLTAIGDGLNVRTRAELAFPEPLDLKFEPWNIPTNLVHDPLISFSAVNGIQPGLAKFAPWTELHVGPPPNQVFLWAMQGAAVETYFAAPLPDSSNAVYALSGRLMDLFNPWLTTNKMGALQRATNYTGLSWRGFPFLAPFLKSVAYDDNQFAFGGLGPESPLTTPAPEGLIQEVIGHTNLVYYGWEVTGPRIQAGIYTGQLLRVLLKKPQLPEKSSAMLWLKSLSSRLGNCITQITASDSTHLGFVRKGPIGLTSAELHLLADWLESPDFPYHPHTFAPPSAQTAEEGVIGGTSEH